MFRLNIFNIKGEKIVELYKGYKSVGDHSIDWNAKEFPSGLYFVKMKTNNHTVTSENGFSQTQKLMLVK